MDNQKFSSLMYFLTKLAANDSFEEFLEEIDLSQDDYEKIKKYLEEKYQVKTYV
jgi:hypothetical protein